MADNSRSPLDQKQIFGGNGAVVEPQDLILQSAASTFDAAFAGLKAAATNPQVIGAIEGGARFLGTQFLAGGVILGAAKDGPEGAFKGFVGGAAAIEGAELGAVGGPIAGAFFPPAEVVTIPLGTVIGGFAGNAFADYINSLSAPSGDTGVATSNFDQRFSTAPQQCCIYLHYLSLRSPIAGSID